jgi:sporulation protein YlmC with PRC-barrel domain
VGETTRFEIGSEVSCSDGACGKLITVVVNPVTRAVTHLVVEPRGRWGLGRLVPVELVTEANSRIELSCTTDEFAQLEGAEETEFLSGAGSDWGYQGDVLRWPYFGLSIDGSGVFDDFGGNVPQAVVHETLPVGEVPVRRGDEVHATDGSIGRVRGLIIDPRDHTVSHVLLQEGHLWGRKEVAIPITDVQGVEDGIHLRISKADVQNLPPVKFS